VTSVLGENALERISAVIVEAIVSMVFLLSKIFIFIFIFTLFREIKRDFRF